MSAEREAPDKHLFSEDRPISTLKEDRLGRRGFSEELALAIRGWKGLDSLVIALYGPWGTGKSSIKNMVIDALRAVPQSASIVDFNPWQRANRTQLSEAFFDEVGIAIGKGPVATRKDQKQALNKWKRYAARLKGASGLLGLFVELARWILIISAVLLLSSTFINNRVVSIAVGILFAVAAGMTWFSKFAEQIVVYREAGTDVGRKSLEEIKTDVREELARLSMPILVVIDDLDRLTPPELLEMFQLIKANGDFPNLVYLLLGDRTVIEAHIQELIKASGRDYLEKIVQVAFDVPVIERKRVHQILFKRLDVLLSDEAVSKHFDQLRWGNLFVGSLQHYFETLRQVNRFISTLSFHISLFKKEGSFEVNAIDLIGLEVLRVCEPEVYRVIAASKDLLTSVSSLRRNEKEDRERINTFLETVPAERKARVQEIIKQKFPPAAWAFGGSHYGTDSTEPWYRELRACSDDVFDRYFHFALPEGDLSQAEIERLLSASVDRDTLRMELNNLSRKGLLEVAVDRLEAYKQEIPFDRAVPFITAIFDVGDVLSADRGSMFEISPAMHAQRIVLWYLKQEEDPAKRGQVLLAATEQTEGLTLPVAFTSLIEPHPENKGELKEFVTVGDWERLKALCVSKIKLRAEGDQLPAKSFSALLFRWKDWAGKDGPSAFCDQLIRSDEGLLQFLRAFVARATSQGMGDYVAKPRWYVRSREIEAFLPFELVESRVNTMPSTASLSPEDQRAITAFKRAAERRRAGKSDDDPFERD